MVRRILERERDGDLLVVMRLVDVSRCLEVVRSCGVQAVRHLLGRWRKMVREVFGVRV